MDTYTLIASGGDEAFIKHLHAELTKGGSPQQRKNPVSKKVQQILYKAGWRPGWTKEKLVSLNDEMFQGSRNVLQIAIHIVIMWLAEQETVERTSDSIFRNLIALGLIPKIAGKIAKMVNPLRNTHYTDTQLLLICIEIALDCRPNHRIGSSSDDDSDL